MEFFLLLVVFLLLALVLLLAQMGWPSVVVAVISFSTGTSMHVAMHGKVCNSAACQPIYQVECTMILRSSFR
jgi:hypothetical protein